MSISIEYTVPELDAEYDCIVIFDGLNDYERQTYTDSQQVAAFVRGAGFLVEVIECNTGMKYIAELRRLAGEAAGRRLRVFLHYECHGSGEGLTMGNDMVSWATQAPLLAELNREMGDTLIVNLSACFGIHAAKANSAAAEYPFFGAIAPAAKIPMKCAAQITLAFYRHFLAGEPINQAVLSANADLGQEALYCLSSEGFRALQSQGLPFRRAVDATIECPELDQHAA